MKRQPYSTLGYYVQRRREEHLLCRCKLARLIGFENSKEGAAAIRLLEEQGLVDPPDLLFRVSIILHLDATTIERLQDQDRKAAGDWLRKISEPFKPYLGLRTIPLPCMSQIPDEVIGWGAEAIEHYAKDFARMHGFEVYAVLSRRVRMEFDRAGELVAIREAGQDGFLRAC